MSDLLYVEVVFTKEDGNSTRYGFTTMDQAIAFLQSENSIQKRIAEDEMFCNIHQCERVLVDYEEESRYECPECKREDGEILELK